MRTYNVIHVCIRCRDAILLFALSLSLSLSYFLLHMQASPVNCLSSHIAHSPQHTVHCHTLHHITHITSSHTPHTCTHTYVCTCNNHCNFIRVHMISTNAAMPLVISMRPPHAHMHVSTLTVTQALTSPHLSLSLSLSLTTHT